MVHTKKISREYEDIYSQTYPRSKSKLTMAKANIHRLILVSFSFGNGAKTRSASRLEVRRMVILGSVLERETPRFPYGEVGEVMASSEISVEKRSLLGEGLGDDDFRRRLRLSRPREAAA